MNKLTIIGNLTRDPVVRTVNTAAGEVNVCSFGVAVNRRNRSNNGQQAEQTDFFNVTAWRQLGDVCGRYLAKGRKVCVVGSVSARTFQGQDGVTRASLEVTAEDVEFLSSRNDDAAYNGGNGGYAAPAPAQPMAPTAQNNGFTQVDNEDLPF